MGDSVRFRDASVRARLLERSRRRSVMVPKNARADGEMAADVGDIWPVDSVDF